MRYASANSRGVKGGHPELPDDRPIETIQASRPLAVRDGVDADWNMNAPSIVGIGYGDRRRRRGAVAEHDRASPTVQTQGRGRAAIVIEGQIAPALPAKDRPEYRIPLMSEIAALRGSSGLVAVSTFSGAGGSCLGLEWAGYEVRWASEFIPAAAATYRLNHPGVPLDTRDIRTVTADEIVAASGLAVGEIDLLEGSPPCAAFSTAGRREVGWGKVRKYSDTEQRVDDLFEEFTRLVRELQPRTFVAENVSGLVKGVAKGYFKETLRAMKAAGYRVEARLLDAQWLGVPQARQRIIFVGVREDLGYAPAFPKPLAYRYSLRDAIGSVAVGHIRDVSESRDQTVYPPERPAASVLVTTYRPLLVVEPETDISGYAIGAEYDRLSPGESSDRYFNLVRPDEAKPSPSLTASGGGGGGYTPGAVASVTHPTERRKFSIAELRRVCGFPDDFELTGSYAQQWERLGRAVPPPMMRAVAETLRDEVLLPWHANKPKP